MQYTPHPVCRGADTALAIDTYRGAARVVLPLIFARFPGAIPAAAMSAEPSEDGMSRGGLLFAYWQVPVKLMMSSLPAMTFDCPFCLKVQFALLGVTV